MSMKLTLSGISPEFYSIFLFLSTKNPFSLLYITILTSTICFPSTFAAASHQIPAPRIIFILCAFAGCLNHLVYGNHRYGRPSDVWKRFLVAVWEGRKLYAFEFLHRFSFDRSKTNNAFRRFLECEDKGRYLQACQHAARLTRNFCSDRLDRPYY